MRRTVLSALFALVLPSQDTPITHATVRLVVKPEPAIRVTLVNRRASALTDVQIRLFPADARGINTFRSFQPLDARGERSFDVRTYGAIVARASVILAVFEDGYYEGTPEAIADWKKERQAAADDLVYWI